MQETCDQVKNRRKQKILMQT